MHPSNFRFLFVALALLLFSTSLLAHTKLTDSSPAADESLAQSPQELQLTFGDPVRLMRIELSDGDGNDIALDFKPDGEMNAEHSHALPEPLPAGEYTIIWRALAGDGHTMTGTVRFNVESGHD